LQKYANISPVTISVASIGASPHGKNVPHTKVFREERERPALLFVDQSQHMFFGSQQRLKSVAAAELAARIAWQITAGGDRIGGMVLDNLGHHMFRPLSHRQGHWPLVTAGGPEQPAVSATDLGYHLMPRRPAED
jgi:hypothetical protein